MNRLLFLLAGLLGLVLWPAAAFAHPLGNFTVNRYSRIEPAVADVRVRYVVDMAEIPTFQELPLVDAGYARRKAAELAGGLKVSLDGTAAPLTVDGAQVSLADGQGGLKTLRLEAWLRAPRHGSHLAYQDTNFSGRIGWSEIVVPGGRDVSDELRSYPDGLLSSPLDQRSVALDLDVAGTPGTVSVPFRLPGEGGLGKAGDDLARLVSSADLSLAVVVFSLLSALLLGALHALSPGHGKTVVAAYLVGSRGTAFQALLLGLTVTATHTAGVFALGLATLFASRYVLPEQLYPWLGVASGALVMAIGCGLFVPRLRAALLGAQSHDDPVPRPSRSENPGEGTHVHGDHGHAHAHDHVHAHSHGIVHSHAHAPSSLRQIVGLGVSGGLLPCPSALVVLLSAISLHRVGFGLILIVTFSLGLASVLTGVGLLLVYSGSFLRRIPTPRRLALALPAASALVVVLAGVAIGAEGLSQAGMLRI